MLVPVPIMIVACAAHLKNDSFYSYASFAAIEVLIITTIGISITLIDAISVLRCTNNKLKDDSNRIKTGAHYESEDEDLKKKRNRMNKDVLEFGADELSRLDRNS